jgi:hypothetical protein
MSYQIKKLAAFLATLFGNTVEEVPADSEHGTVAILAGEGDQLEFVTFAGQSIQVQNTSSGPTLYILMEGILAEQKFIDECLKDRDFASQIGSKALSNCLHSVLRARYADESDGLDLEAIVKDEVLKPLRGAIRPWRVRIPVKNLIVQSTVRVGAVDFIPFDEGVVLNTKFVLDFRGPKDPAMDISNKAMFLKVINEVAAMGSAWIVAEIRSHPDRVKEVAIDHIDASLNLIRAFTHAIFNREAKPAFGLPSELAGGRVALFAESGDSIKIPFETGAFLAPYQLHEDMLAVLRKDWEFDRLSRIVGVPWRDLNTLESAIRVATIWLGRSIVARSTAEAFTHCAIALERLLITDSEDTTVERFADRLALLLADNSAERMQVHSNAKKLYDVRSRIVHAGFDSVEVEQLAMLEWMAMRALAIAASLTESLKSHAELKDSLHAKKMS